MAIGGSISARMSTMKWLASCVGPVVCHADRRRGVKRCRSTVGSANPVLTGLCLARRIATHLPDVLQRPS